MLIQVQLSSIVSTTMTACWFFFSSANKEKCTNSENVLTMSVMTIIYSTKVSSGSSSCMLHYVAEYFAHMHAYGLTSSAVSPPACTPITMMVLR